MSAHTASIRAQLWQKMRDPEYREAFVSAHLSTNIAAQISSLRESQPEPWTKRKLAEKTGMAAARISVLENPAYDKHTLSTLKRIAKAFDVALVVRFEAYSTLVKWVSELSPEKMAVPSFARDSIADDSPPEVRFQVTGSGNAILGSIHPASASAEDHRKGWLSDTRPQFAARPQSQQKSSQLATA